VEEEDILRENPLLKGNKMKRKTLKLEMDYHHDWDSFNCGNVSICAEVFLLLWNVPPNTKKIWLSITDQSMKGYESVLIRYNCGFAVYPELIYYENGQECRPIDLAEYESVPDSIHFHTTSFRDNFDKAIALHFGKGEPGEPKEFYVRIQV